MNASHERKRILKAYGAELVLTPADEGSDGAIRRVREIYEADPTAISIPTSTATTPTGRRTSKPPAPKSSSRPKAASPISSTLLGTSGTFMGNARRLQRDLPHVECISAQPSTGFHGIEGTKHMPTAIVPAHLRPEARRRAISGSKPKTPTRMVQRLAREEGMLVGISAGGNVAGGAHDREGAARAGQRRRDRHHPLRRRRQISERAVLGRRPNDSDRTRPLARDGEPRPGQPIPTNAAAP